MRPQNASSQKQSTLIFCANVTDALSIEIHGRLDVAAGFVFAYANVSSPVGI
jgi:hypothetical protein